MKCRIFFEIEAEVPKGQGPKDAARALYPRSRYKDVKILSHRPIHAMSCEPRKAKKGGLRLPTIKRKTRDYKKAGTQKGTKAK